MKTVLIVLFVCFIAFVLVPLLLLVVFVITQRKRLSRMLLATDGDIDSDLRRLISENPSLSEDQLAQKALNSASVITAVFGLATGIGGVFTIPLLVTVDTAVTLRRQMRVVQMIFAIYNNRRPADEYLILVLGGSGATELLLKLFVRILIKLPWEIPFIGGVICAAINYFVTQGVGKAAIAKARGERIRLGAIATNIIQETKQKATDSLTGAKN